jgi:hypothetical protein
MTLPQNVKDAVAQLDNAMMFHADDLSYASWTAIRAHLLSQEAEIERLQSRLAAANALLRECRRMAARLLPTPHDLYEQIDAFLQGATHDRA